MNEVCACKKHIIYENKSLLDIDSTQTNYIQIAAFAGVSFKTIKIV